MKEEIKCLKCGSTQIKKVEGIDDFLSRKDEGELAKKANKKTKQKYFCLEKNCGYEWEENLDFNSKP